MVSDKDALFIFPGKQLSDMVPFISGDTMEADKKTPAQTVSDRYD